MQKSRGAEGILWDALTFGRKAARRSARVAIIATLAMLANSRVAHADPTPRSYVGNFLGYNAEPADYFSLQGSESSGLTAASGYLEKRISLESSISIFGGAQRYDGLGGNGWNNIEISYKHIILDLRDQELLLSLAPSLEIPVGDPSVSETHPRGGLDFLYEKGFAGLPESLAPLRAFAMEGDFYWDSKLSGARDDLIFTNAELEYSIEYLNENVMHVTSNDFFRYLTPHIDFDYAQYFSAHRNTSYPDFELTPAVAWLNSTFEVNLGTQIALNPASSSTGSVGFVWLVGVSLDQIWKGFGWTPFH